MTEEADVILLRRLAKMPLECAILTISLVWPQRIVGALVFNGAGTTLHDFCP
jgi:hypothetical protein